MSIPPDAVLPFGNTYNLSDMPELIEENVDGEESKETVVSMQDRIRGTTFVKRGQLRGSNFNLASENDTTSQVDTNMWARAFNSRLRVTEFEAFGK